MDLRAALAKRDHGNISVPPKAADTSDLFRSTWDPESPVAPAAETHSHQASSHVARRPSRESEVQPLFHNARDEYDSGANNPPSAASPRSPVADPYQSSSWSRRAGASGSRTSDQSRDGSRATVLFPAKILPPVRQQDKGLRWMCLTALRYPLQFLRHWQSVTIVLVYLCIFLMLYDLHLRRDYRLRASLASYEAGIDLNFSASMLPTSLAPDMHVSGATAASAGAGTAQAKDGEHAPGARKVAAAGSNGNGPAAGGGDPNQFKIYILPLDADFNTGCVDKLTNIKATIKQDFGDNGLGPVLDEHDDHHIHFTSSLALEVIFHSRLKSSQWYTAEPSQAHAVFVPYFGALLTTFPHCRGSMTLPQVEEKVANAVTSSALWTKIAKERFFTVLGLPEGNFLAGGKCGGAAASGSTASSFLCDKLLAPMTVVVPELVSAADVGKRIFKSTMLAPMPSAVHLDVKNMQTASFGPLSDEHAAKRGIGLAYIMDASLGHSALNDAVDAEIATARQDPHGLKIVKLDIALRASIEPPDWELRIIELMRRSTFCLFQPGQPSISSLLIYSITLGCIPVLLRPMDLPFVGTIAYDKFVIQLPEDKIAAKTYSFTGFLSQLSAGTDGVAMRRAELRAAALHLHYAQPEPGSDLATLQQSKDAFNVAMDMLIAKLTAKP